MQRPALTPTSRKVSPEGSSERSEDPLALTLVRYDPTSCRKRLDDEIANGRDHLRHPPSMKSRYTRAPAKVGSAQLPNYTMRSPLYFALEGGGLSVFLLRLFMPTKVGPKVPPRCGTAATSDLQKGHFYTASAYNHAVMHVTLRDP